MTLSTWSHEQQQQQLPPPGKLSMPATAAAAADVDKVLTQHAAQYLVA
jgi:hypothetical protein